MSSGDPRHVLLMVDHQSARRQLHEYISSLVMHSLTAHWPEEVTSLSPESSGERDPAQPETMRPGQGRKRVYFCHRGVKIQDNN